MIVLVDTNVLLDVVTDNAEWYDWSVARMNGLALQHTLAINDIIYAELSPSFDRFEEVSSVVAEMRLQLRPIPTAAQKQTNKTHKTNRRAGGVKTGILPDFLIGAQAAVEGLPVLTRDTRRFRSYFPTVELITP